MSGFAPDFGGPSALLVVAPLCIPDLPSSTSMAPVLDPQQTPHAIA